jgi:hypothetical protein
VLTYVYWTPEVRVLTFDYRNLTPRLFDFCTPYHHEAEQSTRTA